MPSNRKPKCFVAMAFDQADTDAMYDNAIEKVLKKNGVAPVIINRRQDNRDINHQIIEQLDCADFCIVDLTYTRPSVYFEAGYAQRHVEVIYTVRADHLKKAQPENRRVHFDLQMKPIIKWESPDDPTFAKRLERRMKETFLRKWKAKAKQVDADKRAKESFLALSTNEKTRFLRSAAIYTLHKQGFHEWCIHDAGLGALQRRGFGYVSAALERQDVYRRPTQHARLDATFVARRRIGNRLIVASVYAAESVTKTQLRDETAFCFVRSREPIHLLTGYDDAQRSKIKTTEEHHIVASLRSIPKTRIMSVMPNLFFDASNDRYGMNATFSQRVLAQEPPLEIPRQLFFHFMPTIVSEPSFKASLSKILDQIPKLP